MALDSESRLEAFEKMLKAIQEDYETTEYKLYGLLDEESK